MKKDIFILVEYGDNFDDQCSPMLDYGYFTAENIARQKAIDLNYMAFKSAVNSDSAEDIEDGSGFVELYGANDNEIMESAIKFTDGPPDTCVIQVLKFEPSFTVKEDDEEE